MNELINTEKIENKIYEIRGKQVMLDRDLARLYRVETKAFNQAVKRNIKRFPDEFMFQMNEEEFSKWRSHFVTSKSDRMGLRRPPYAFTEQGVAMLSGILRSDIAIEMSIKIMKAFVDMRHYLIENKADLPHRVLLLEEKVDKIFDKFNSKEIPNNMIFYEGQTYDAYSFLLDILKEAKEEIIIIDNYTSKKLLDTLKNIDKNIIIISSNIDDNLKNKYESQYNNITFINTKIFHDRFIVIDKSIVYTCGASFKDLGQKCFAINKITSDDTRKYFIDKIKEL